MSLAIPNFFDIRSQIAANFVAVFGNELNTDSNSTTGELIDLISNSFLQLYQLLQAVDLNGYVQQAQGQSLDNLLALINVFRPQGTQTVIPNVTLTGTPGTLIPAGSQAATASGNIFYSANDATIGVGGTALVNFIAQSVGSIIVESNQLNTIITVIPGWSAVVNGSAGIPGLNAVPDSTLRANLPKLVNQYSLGYLGNIKAKIYSNTSVIDAFIYENDKSVVSPPPYNSPNNSLWIILYYEDATQEDLIANAIFNSKAAVSTYSSGLYPQVTKSVTDISGNPHDITWNRAVTVPLYIEVQLVETSQLTVDIFLLIRNTLINYIKDVHKIGQILYYNRFLSSITNLNKNIEIENFWVSTVNPPNSSNNVDLVPNFYQIYTLKPENINITLL